MPYLTMSHPYHWRGLVTLCVLACAVGVRVAVPLVTSVSSVRPGVHRWWSSPATNPAALDEAVFLLHHDSDPYEAGRHGVVHDPPLVVALAASATTVVRGATPPPPLLLLVINVTGAALLDLVAALLLRKVALEVHRNGMTGAQRADTVLSPNVVALLYMFNPFTIASSVARPALTQQFTSIALLAALQQGLAHKGGVRAAAWLAVAAYLALYPAMLLLPLLAMSRTWPKGLLTVVVFAASFAALLGLSFLYLGSHSWRFVDATYGFLLAVPDLSPNVGLFWYFFIEMFDVFRTFFLVLLQAHVFVYALPVTWKFWDHPVLAFTILVGVMTLFKPYTTVADSALFFGLFMIFSNLFRYMRVSFYIGNMLVYAVVLGAAFFHLWTIEGSGNVNFFYAITLAYGFAHILAVIDLIYAHRRYHYDAAHPEFIGLNLKMSNS